MKLTAKEIIERYNSAYSIKTSWDTEYRNVFEYCMPSRDGYQKAVSAEKVLPDFQDRRENLYSSVGEQSASDFVNTMQEVLCPPQGDWISLKSGSRIKTDDAKKLDVELGKISDLANEHKNMSTFDMAFSEFCYDVFAGTGCMLILPGKNPTQPISFRAIPLRQYCIEEGAYGEVRAVYRKFTMKRELVKYQWKELKSMKVLSSDACKDMNLIECTYYDYDLHIFHYQVINQDEEMELVAREYKTNPFVVLRWNKMAGEPYGRGVGLTALNDIKTLNLIKYYGLRNLAFNTPPLLVQEDDMLDIDGLTLEPWSLNVVPDTDSSIVPLQINTNHNIESFRVRELTMDIKRNTFASTLPTEGARQLTATEIITRKKELQRALNSVFGRLISEFQIPLIRRIFDVLIDTKVIKAPNPETGEQGFDVAKINGFIYKVNIITPLGRIVKQGEAQALLNIAATLVNFDPSGQVLANSTDLPGMISRFLELEGLPAKFIKTPEEIKTNATEAARAQGQAAQAAAEADVATANAKEMGKAGAKIVQEEATRG